MDLHTVLRSRIAAAAVGVTVLGVTAALVPTVSTATVPTTSASPNVTWTDSAADFTAAPETAVPLTDQWYWASLGDPTAGGSITDHATIDADGLSVSAGEAVGIIRGLTKPVAPSGLGALVSGASATTTGATSFALAIQSTADSSDQTVVFAAGDGDAGLSGASTEWIDPATGTTESTSELATDLSDAGAQVVGYIVYVGLDASTGIPAPGPTDEPTAPTTESPAPTVAPTDPTVAPGGPLDLSAPLESTAQALAADASGSVSALRVDDTTTYFTPQPTAVTSVEDTRVSQSVSGFQVVGSGFAPAEGVQATITQGGETYAVATNASVADQDGDVVVVVALPEGVATAGAFTATLVGTSSGQTASAAATFIADPAGPAVAPVAVPVPGTASFTG
ncbi:hypothetical protein [Curtobacterium flaccumfaciens]|uniref:hypothetical protein n=1 Tax=Curtobacterium flaccumfaciens TaxID=2035 RepID=UPI000482E03E|nr:hypothetical protein [Curtobacterium flaccumfaciens]MBT1630843.1 hypothetical protein [Curtobacterium flaccumfaciens pv. oortii]MCX2846569.1 hypothetical protein [Curtobacterium flaccumfaciens pv. oortii]QKS86418.1 hypothetical protein FK523_01935 [Curtobacterium flaccumfaciens pv. flaccumfaciens]